MKIKIPKNVSFQTLEKYTMEQVFLFIIVKLKKQGIKSVKRYEGDDIHICCYRGDNGAKCAVGHLIPEKIYRSDMERKSFQLLLENFSNIIKRPSDQMYQLLNDMQSEHDNAEKHVNTFDDALHSFQHTLERNFTLQQQQNIKDTYNALVL